MSISFEIIKISPRAKSTIDYSTIIFKVNFPKRLELDTSNDYWTFFKTLVDGGVLKMVVNLEAVEYIDSAGIGVLINTAKLLRKAKGDLAISNVQQNIKEIFDVVNLHNFIKLFNTEVEAINHFRYI